MKAPLLFALGFLAALQLTACQQSGAAKGTVGASHATNASATKSGDDDGHDGDDEVKIALDQVPEAVKAAALKAVPGLKIEEASKETENGVTVYNIEGTANGKEYELEISADGKVNEVESEDCDDDDGDGK